jgi:restriction system protein
MKTMPIPDYQTLMLPVLRHSAKGEVRIGDVVETLAAEFKLSDDDLAELIPSGKQTHFAISNRGLEILHRGVEKIDIKFLKQFDEFIEFQNRTNAQVRSENNVSRDINLEELPTTESQTPDDLMRITSITIHAALGNEIIDRLRLSKPAFFERVVVQLLLAMGYGGTLAQAGKAIGKSGDNGVDGVIDQDTLGLDRVYVQAKRYAEDVTVGAGDIRDFFGSLDMHKATKGLFVTTSSFTKSATETAEKLGKRIVLIDGRDLTKLMIRFNVGCRVEEIFEMKKIDEEFFE